MIRGTIVGPSGFWYGPGSTWPGAKGLIRTVLASELTADYWSRLSYAGAFIVAIRDDNGEWENYDEQPHYADEGGGWSRNGNNRNKPEDVVVAVYDHHLVPAKNEFGELAP